MPEYTAIDICQHPDGVLLPGETATLPEEVGERGIAAGTLVVAQSDPADSTGTPSSEINVDLPAEPEVQTEPLEGLDQSPKE